MSKKILLSLSLAALANAQEPHPHSISSCSDPARLSSVRHGLAHSLSERDKISMEEAFIITPPPHPCVCSGMVADVQKSFEDLCWTTVGLERPDNPFEMSVAVEIFPSLKKCLALQIPDHCTVIANGSDKWRSKGIQSVAPHPEAGAAYNRCSTSCKPEKCFCSDTSCVPHSFDQTDTYYEKFEALPTIPENRQ